MFLGNNADVGSFYRKLFISGCKELENRSGKYWVIQVRTYLFSAFLLIHSQKEKTLTSIFGFAFVEMLLECEGYMTKQEGRLRHFIIPSHMAKLDSVLLCCT